MRTVKQELTDAPLDSITPHPDNPRRGDVRAIRGSIEATGFYGAVIVQRSSGYIIAGSHRWQAARAIGADTVPALVADVTDEEAVRIMAADNRTSDLAGYDAQTQLQMLMGLAEMEAGMAGSGYGPSDLEELRSAH